jgi:four helix bundle protein
VQLNIAEGYAFGECASFTRHLAIAYGSAVETGDLLEVLIDAQAIADDLGKHILMRNRRSQRLILGLLRRRKENDLTAHRSRSS